jgi:hypothetical protein
MSDLRPDTVARMVAEAKEHVETLPVERVAAEIEGGEALLIDVREEDERLLEGALALSKTLIKHNRPGYGNHLFGTSWTRKECPAKPGGVGCRSRPAARAAFSAASHAGPRVPHPICAWLPTSLSPPSSVVGTAREAPDHPALQAPGTSPFDTVFRYGVLATTVFERRALARIKLSTPSTSRQKR